MTAALLVAAAGGFGAVARFFLDGVITSRAPARYPVGTTVVNVTGSLLLGLVTGLVLGQVVMPSWQLVVGTGFLGGYTTFSTASVQTVRLLQERRLLAALANGLAQLVVSVLVGAAGLWCGLQA